MRYQCTTGLDAGQVDELVARIFQVLSSRPHRGGRPVLLGLFRQVELVLVLLRHDLTQMTAGDLFEVSQPTVSRIWRRLLPLVEEVTCMSEIGLGEAVRNRTVLVDGAYVPTGNRAGRTNYAGKRHCRCLSVQVACDLDGTFLAVSAPVAGARHDAYAIAATGWQKVLTATDWIADTAYMAAGALTPIRKPRTRPTRMGTTLQPRHILPPCTRRKVNRPPRGLTHPLPRLPRPTNRAPRHHPHHRQTRTLPTRMVTYE